MKNKKERDKAKLNKKLKRSEERKKESKIDSSSKN